MQLVDEWELEDKGRVGVEKDGGGGDGGEGRGVDGGGGREGRARAGGDGVGGWGRRWRRTGGEWVGMEMGTGTVLLPRSLHLSPSLFIFPRAFSHFVSWVTGQPAVVVSKIVHNAMT